MDETSDVPHAHRAIEHLQDRPLAFFNALLTEHFVLESARGITVSESSSRASVYLTTLSSSLVAYGFLAQTPVATAFLAVVLPVVVILGVFTYERLVDTSLEDVTALASIQRIRRYYSGLLPGAGEFFPAPADSGAPNEMLDIGRRASWRGVFFTISSAIGAVNSMVAGAGVALLLDLVVPAGSAIALGVAAAVLIGVVHGIYQQRRYRQMVEVLRAR